MRRRGIASMPTRSRRGRTARCRPIGSRWSRRTRPGAPGVGPCSPPWCDRPGRRAAGFALARLEARGLGRAAGGRRGARPVGRGRPGGSAGQPGVGPDVRVAAGGGARPGCGPAAGDHRAGRPAAGPANSQARGSGRAPPVRGTGAAHARGRACAIGRAPGRKRAASRQPERPAGPAGAGGAGRAVLVAVPVVGGASAVVPPPAPSAVAAPSTPPPPPPPATAPFRKLTRWRRERSASVPEFRRRRLGALAAGAHRSSSDRAMVAVAAGRARRRGDRPRRLRVIGCLLARRSRRRRPSFDGRADVPAPAFPDRPISPRARPTPTRRRHHRGRPPLRDHRRRRHGPRNSRGCVLR